MLSLIGAPVPPIIQGRIFLGEQAASPREYSFGARDRCDETVFRLRTVRDARNRRLVPRAEVERLSARPRRHATGGTLSARNRFAGVVRSVEVDGVMALVELEAGPFLVTAAITRDAVEEMRLAPGVAAAATVKATSVMIERDGRR